VDRAIAETIDRDPDLRGKRDLLLSVSGVGETLAGILLAEMPGPDVLRRGAEVSLCRTEPEPLPFRHVG
jgi:hypothetical protein